MTSVRRNAIAIFALASLASCGVLPPGGAVFVIREPPRSRAEVRIESPGPGFMWIGGNWRWEREDYVWVSGRWERPSRPNGRWESGSWRHHKNGYYWTEGRWR